MINYENFISKEKSLLIAPAGYGKTYTIAKCLKYTENKNKYLILTHTHAGVASIKEKIKEKKIEAKKYHIETITSFAQKYTLAFYFGDGLPKQENSNNYFSFMIEKATELFNYSSIQKVVSRSYEGLIVDEYQDCTIKQHQLIQKLGEVLNLSILGDSLQGIFDFNEEIVDLENNDNFSDYIKYKLTNPWRWELNGNKELGKDLKKLRDNLVNNKKVNFFDYSNIEFYICEEKDKYNFKSDYYKKINDILENKSSLLIIHPVITNIKPREKIIKLFNNRLHLIEAIDDKDFYKLAKVIDNVNNSNVYSIIREISFNIFNKTEIKKWFNKDRLVNKRSNQDKKIIKPIKKLLAKFKGIGIVSFSLISKILQKVYNITGIKCYRKDLFYSLINALEKADIDNCSVYESMEKIRNIRRRKGRKINGKCIGTTLLIKGLEFETVIILDAHKFESIGNLKHFYVALTRASKNLIVFSKKKVLNFN